jgi:hypothetical protein
MSKFKKSLLLTHNKLELECLIISRKTLITGGEEALVYCQSRLVKGFINDDDSFVAEMDILVEDIFSQSLEDELNNLSNHGISGHLGF